MDRQIENAQAWPDFWNWIRRHENWQPLTRPQKHYLYKAQYAHNAGRLGDKRIKSILEKYAEHRYTFKGVVIIHE